ncbi:MAG: nicotinamide N-methylase [Oceanicaulis sp.]|nr:nicotinamide N-methylase [Oceanicaulis sp.]MAZ90534.1 nicotinamide N-methylase [Maricaulis sp.]MBI74037.1 nicotinamide N-methylase [Oceanicaulis sp.]
MPPPLVPEVPLHLAVETVALWQETEEALGELGLPPPFWAFAWAGGQALARYCLDNPDIVRGRHVLDFAAGSGLTGIAALKSGTRTVEASELDAFAIAAIEANAAANHVTVTARLEDVVGRDDGWDVVLAGDVFYEADLALRIGDWLAGLHRRGATVLIGDPGRAFLPKGELEEVARYTVPVQRELEDREVRFAKVWRFA